MSRPALEAASPFFIVAKVVRTLAFYRDRLVCWDAYVYAPDVDARAAELTCEGVAFSEPLRDTHEGLRGFELTDPDGHVLFFGHPR